jgi:hypothetical protein
VAANKADDNLDPVYVVRVVSIPHSEFCSLKPNMNIALYLEYNGFNSPLGILFVEAAPIVRSHAWLLLFQFPTRNSVR